MGLKQLLEQGHDVTIATRGKTPDNYGDNVQQIILQRANEESVRETLNGTHFDVVDCNKYMYMPSTSIYDSKTIDTKENDFYAVAKELIWCDRKAFPYEEIKRQVECALW